VLNLPTSPDAIKRFLLYKPPPPPIQFKGADPNTLRYLIDEVGEHELLVKTKPRVNQLEGLAFALWYRRALLFFEMRTGKTKLALDFISYLIYSALIRSRGLIIAHAPIGVDEWEKQIPFHSHLDICTIRSGPLSYERFVRAAQSDRYDAVLVAWSTLQQMFTIPGKATKGRNKGKEKLFVDHDKCREIAPYFSAAVIDEIHMAGHNDTLRFGIASELVKHCDWRLGLTGTPFGRDPLLMWSQAFLIDDGKALSTSFYFFREAFSTKKYNPFSKSQTDYTFDARKLPLLRDKTASLVMTYGLREIQEINVLPGVVQLSISGEQRTAYNEVIERLVQLRIGDSVAIENTFVRLRQVASGYLPFVDDMGHERVVHFPDAAKFVWLEDFLPEIPNDLQCIIFHEFIATGERICQILRKLKISHEWLRGGTRERPALLTRFQSGQSQILVANTATGGMSIDISAADYMIFFESPASVIIRKQAEARPLSRGNRPLVMDDIVCAPIEQKLLDFVLEGESLRDALLKDPKGLAEQLRL
jgi:superfamily II DNA or RNA helicase